MTWDIARVDIPCSRCDAVVRVGEPFRYMARGHHRYCAGCAFKSTQEQPPAQEPVARPTPLVGYAEKLARFNRTEMAAKVRGNILDYKAKQVGE